MDMECSAGLWIGFLLGLLFMAPSEIQADVSKLSASSGHNYFSEGGGLVSSLDTVSRGKNILGNQTLSSLDNVTRGANVSKDPKLGPSEQSGPLSVKLAQLNSNNATDQFPHNHPAPIVHDPLSNTLLVDLHKSTPNKSSSDTGKVVTVSPLNVSSTVVPRKKSKPGLTYNKDDLPRDEHGREIVTKENLVGAEPSFDYVVPIVVALLAVPFVAILAAFLYKKSRDFWDRRHYRRMDFLIDGMYND